jgi:hypothetical protein
MVNISNVSDAAPPLNNYGSPELQYNYLPRERPISDITAAIANVSSEQPSL